MARKPALPRLKNAPGADLSPTAGHTATADAPEKTVFGVFLNIPYDEGFVDLYLAYLAGISSFGLTPRATIEIPGGELRVERIFKLLAQCPWSIHDVSRLEARFNMPFELGLAVAWAKLEKPSEHLWFVFAGGSARTRRAFSDLLGSDSYFHRSRPSGVLRELCNAFVRTERRPTIGQMTQIFRDLKKALPAIMAAAGAKSPFTARVFSELRLLAAELTRRYLIFPASS